MVEEFIFFLSAAAAEVKLNCVRPTSVCGYCNLELVLL